MPILIRGYQPSDLTEMKRLTVEGFAGISLDQNIEQRLGSMGGHNWEWRKARQVEDDVVTNAAGVFVAEEDGRVLGYISTRLDHSTGRGRIPNLAVDAEARGQGLGRRLIEHALDYFRREGLSVALIETMSTNAVGRHLYPSCGFSEVGQLVHYACRL